jgi:hypothetical protein
MILHPRSAAPELLRFYRDFMEQAPEELCGGVALITAPPEDFVPEAARGKPACGVIVAYLGNPEEGEEAFRPLLEWGEPALKMVQPMPYVAVQQMIDAGNPWGIGEYFKVDYLEELPDEAIDAAVEKATEIGSPFTQVIVFPMGGAMSRVDNESMALEIPDAKWGYFCLAMWMDPGAAERERTWAREFMDTMRPWAVDKAPPNFISPDDAATRLRTSYGDEKFARLVELKDKYDPENVFALNQNIPPSLKPA